MPNVQLNGLNDGIVSLSRNAEPQRDYRATVVVGQVNRRRGNDPQPRFGPSAARKKAISYDGCIK